MIWRKEHCGTMYFPQLEYSCKQRVKGILGWWWVGTEEMANIYPSSSLYCALLGSRMNFILPSPEGLLNTDVSRKVMWSLSHLTVILVNTGSSIGRESLWLYWWVYQHISTTLSSLPVLHKQVHGGFRVKCLLLRRYRTSERARSRNSGQVSSLWQKWPPLNLKT